MKFRERVYAIGAAMNKHGLLVTAAPRDRVHAVLGQWRRADRLSWWPWTSADERRRVARMYPRELECWLADQETKKRKKTKRA